MKTIRAIVSFAGAVSMGPGEVRDVADDLAGDTKYAGCETSAYAPETIKSFRKVKRYNYEMMGIVYPHYAETNVLIDYGIIEESEN